MTPIRAGNRWTAVAVLTFTFTLLPTAGSVRAQTPAASAGAEIKVLQERPDRLLAVLPNRMIVAVQELRTAPVVSAQVWVKTGSIYEQEFVGAGLSHFLEHLLAGGSTTTRSEDETNAILGRIGAKTNAATGLDNVHYYIDTTADHADTAIDLLSDWMRNSVISDAEYQRERQVIQREFEHGLGSPGRVFWKLTQQARYRAHPARHPTIGYLQQFLSISRDQIYDFYRRMYVPNNMLFVVVGDVDKHAVLQRIARAWSTDTTGSLPRLSFPVEPELTEPRQYTGVAAITAPKLRLAWPGTQLAERGDYELDLLASILGGGETSRLVRVIRDELQLVNNISAYNASFSWGKGFFGIDADVRVPAGETPQQAIGRVQEAILLEVAKLRSEGVTAAELARAKRQVLAGVMYEGQTANALASRLASDILGMGDADYLQRYARAVQELHPDALQFTAARFLEANKLISVTLLPLPPGERMGEMERPAEPTATDDLARTPVLLDNALVIDRLSAKVLEPVGDDRAGAVLGPVERFTLSNGLRLLVQRSTLTPTASIQLYQLGGLLADEPGREGLANAVSAMLTKGTATRSAQDIALQTEDLGASLDFACGNNTSYARAVCLRDDVPAVLNLLADCLLHSSFPASEWALLQPRLMAAIDRSQESWGGELNARFRAAYFGAAHPWSQMTLGRREVIASLTPADLAQFHQQRLSAKDAVLAVFGDVDPQAIKQAAEELFAALPREAQVPFTAQQPELPVAGVQQFHTDKSLAAVQIGLGPGVDRTDPDYPTLSVLCNLISSFPSGWLEAELRGKGPGLAYAVWAYQATGMIPGYIAVGFNTQPDSVEEATRRAWSVVERAKTASDIDDATLARAKAAVLVGEFLDKQSNSQRAAEAALGELYGLPADDAQRFFAAVRKLTVEELRAAAERHLQNAVTVVISPAVAAPTETPAPAAVGAGS